MALDLQTYSRFVVAYSGGKDSCACVLHLLEQGVPPGLIELHHHLVDGREGSTLMDWAATEGYCRSFAHTLGIPIYFSWKVGGFEGEMNRSSSPTAPTAWECPERGMVHAIGGRGPLGTRLKFPQVAADLNARWCSAYLKVDVMDKVLMNSLRFAGPAARTLVISGERAEESPGRARYAEFEHDRAHRMGRKIERYIDHLRPVHKWPEQAIWEIIARWKIQPHPCYQIGFGRCSCQFCIFGNVDDFATNLAIDPGRLTRIAQYEASFGRTVKRAIKKQFLNVLQFASLGVPYEGAAKAPTVLQAIRAFPIVDLRMPRWELPAGAFRKSGGPV
jgi:3'-phosphoadenosine 5'-phosphosulfate sulfotransferase (PAPS reductase)/FAD synthetase